jgi:adenosylcobalamin-dependent ribonucleoside-triphosphate reductase
MNAIAYPALAGHNLVPSARAQIVERRTYLRPLDEDGKLFETPRQLVDRVIEHQRYLWSNQLKRPLEDEEEAELAELRALIEARKATLSGRVKWMGGTDLVKERASAAFNCSFTTVFTPADLVDVFWLLLQGCGVGFKPQIGMLSGFSPTIKQIDVIGSARKDKGGAEDNTEEWIPETGEWIITVGDSAKAWAKALGKLMASKFPAKRLVLDLSELRPGGKRLKGYGWLSSGWEPLAKAFKRIGQIMMKAAGRLLTALEIGDIINFLGTVLSSRRSAQIWLMDDDHVEAEPFVDFKVGRYETGNEQREQSNNSLLFWSKPLRSRIVDLLTRILSGGDPGFINAVAANLRAPGFQGCNPCAEILFTKKGFCNLVQIPWHRFNGNLKALLRAQWIAARANYRQTCVSMKDGVLQRDWDDIQKLERLCGVAPLGYVSWEGLNNPVMLEAVRDAAIAGANSMADEFGLQRPRRVTQVQPGGTSSKHLGLMGDEVHEGAHLALSRYIFNNMMVSKGEPLIDLLRAANYQISDHPIDETAVLVRIPVEYPASPMFTKTTMQIDGKDEEVEVNLESAVSQLERYRLLMKHYVQHNCSITISFDETEIEAMADWFMEHWDDYVGVSFLRRNDPTKSAKDLGFAYLPQEAVSKRMFDEYAQRLLPLDLSQDSGQDVIDMGDCSTGACPIR